MFGHQYHTTRCTFHCPRMAAEDVDYYQAADSSSPQCRRSVVPSALELLVPLDSTLINVCDSLHLQDQEIHQVSSLNQSYIVARECNVHADCCKTALKTCLLRLLVSLHVLSAVVPCAAVGCHSFGASLLAIAVLLHLQSGATSATLKPRNVATLHTVTEGKFNYETAWASHEVRLLEYLESTCCGPDQASQ